MGRVKVMRGYRIPLEWEEGGEGMLMTGMGFRMSIVYMTESDSKLNGVGIDIITQWTSDPPCMSYVIKSKRAG